MDSRLPYTDSKPQGAADFYFAIQATFRFILESYGRAAWIRYLREMGRGYFEPVNRQWTREGLPGVAAYWKAFFAAEPGAGVEVESAPDAVTVHIHICPAIRQLRDSKREILPCFCQHCYYLNQARAEAAGLSMKVEGGAGTCVHRYAPAGVLQQDLAEIKEVI